jgi:L-ribulose-5-phosphate 3-epimerase
MMKLGVIVTLNAKLDDELKKLNELEIPTCQLNCWDESQFTPQMAELVKKVCRERSIEITALWCGWGGPAVWNFIDGPNTLGLVPVAYRFERMKTLMKGADFAQSIGVKDVITHVGFLPENASDAEYTSVISALRSVAGYFRKQGRNFLFETGQETPVTLLRAIEDIGLDNLGINLDPANLILYGKGNPVDALDVFGKYVLGVHAKDGVYPTTGHYLGEEKPLGQGKVNFPALVARLKVLGYEGALTIEREISGEEQLKDIRLAKEILSGLI